MGGTALENIQPMENGKNRKVQLRELRWYLGRSDFNVQPWWKKESSAPHESSVDRNQVSVRRWENRWELKGEILLWEILRRHTDLKKILDGEWIDSRSSPDQLSNEHVLDMAQWVRRGPSLIRTLITYHNKPWPNTNQESFIRGLPEFLACPQNFPSGKRVRGFGGVTVPQIMPNLMELDHLAPQDRAIREYQALAESSGQTLLVVMYDRLSSPEKVAEGVKNLLKVERALSPGGAKVMPPGRQREYIHLDEKKLELLEDLDSGHDLPLRKVKSIHQLFSSFTLL